MTKVKINWLPITDKYIASQSDFSLQKQCLPKDETKKLAYGLYSEYENKKVELIFTSENKWVGFFFVNKEFLEKKEFVGAITARRNAKHWLQLESI